MRVFVLTSVVLILPALAGCAPAGPRDPGVPREAALVPAADGRTEWVGFAGIGSAAPERLLVEPGGALYVVDVAGGKVAYSGAVEPNQVVAIYPSGVAVAARRKGLGGSTTFERRVATFEAGRAYRVYVHVGGRSAAPTGEVPGSPLTRPYDVRERVVDPTGATKR